MPAVSIELPRKRIQCSDCSKEKLIRKRLPSGWKRKDRNFFCGICWRKRYILRTISLPIAQPLDCTWGELQAALDCMFSATTSCCNWLITELALRDVIRQPEDEKMPPMKRVYLYPEARILYPMLPSSTVGSLEQSITKKYVARRYDVRWLNRASLPCFRYPQPFPVHNKSWSADIQEGCMIISVRVGAARFHLRLKGGPRFRRQITSFRKITSGDAIPGELALYKAGNDLMCKVTLWLPKCERNETLSGTLRVRTSPAADIMVAAINIKDERLWIYNADHIKRWTAEYRRQIQRWQEDWKAEERPTPSFQQRREAAVQKHQCRMNTAVDQVAASLVNYARRAKFATLDYDDTDRSWLLDFVWSRLRGRISTLCDENGIEFRAVNQVTSEPGDI